MHEDSHSKHSLKRTLFWAFAMNWGSQGMGMFVSFGLAIILGPTIFGTVAIAVTFLSLVQVLASQGFEDALVQRHDLKKEHLDSVFWVVLAFSALLMAASIMLSGWWATLNHQPMVAPVMCWLSIRLPIYGLTVVQRAVMVRNFEFKNLAYRSNIAEGIGGLVGLGMAVSGMGIWSLVGQQLGREVSALALLWKMSSWRPKMRFSMAHIKELVPFSSGIFAAVMGSYLQSQSDVLLIGLFFGPTVVGLYRLACRIPEIVITIVSRAIEWVSMPKLAKLQNNFEQLKHNYLLLLRVNVTASAPIMLTLSAASLLLVRNLGEKWYPAATAIEILCIKGCLESTTYLTGSLLRARSRPMQEAKLNWTFGILNALVLTVCAMNLKEASANTQVLVVALCKLAVFAILYLPANAMLAMNCSGASLRELMRSISSGMLAAATAFLVIKVSEQILGEGWSESMKLVFVLISGFLAAAAVLLWLDGELRREVARGWRKITKNNSLNPEGTVKGSEEESDSLPGFQPHTLAKSNQPLVSILIPAYNAEKWISESIQSALDQNWARKEIVVMDDGSTDQTLSIARSFESKNVKVVSQSNQGAAAARNSAYSLAQGDFIQWLDADDMLSNDKVERQMEVLLANSSRRTLASSGWGNFFHRPRKAIFIPTALWVDASPVDWLLTKLNESLFMQTATWLVTRELTDAAGPWDTRLLGDDDGEYFCRVVRASDGVRFVPESKVYFRQIGTNRLSFVGTSDRKMEALFLSTMLHIQYIRSMEDSDRVKAACVRYLQNQLIVFHPQRPDIIKQAEQVAAELNGHLEPPKFRSKYRWIEKAFGSKLAKSAQINLPMQKRNLERFIDSIFWVFEGENNKIGSPKRSWGLDK